MKLEFIGVTELFKDADELILAKLLAAHQAVRDINTEMKLDPEIKELQKQLEELKSGYKKRLLRQKSIIAAAELVAKSRGILLPEDRMED